MNAGINFSVLDGWWAEGYNGKNGWAFGDQGDIHNLEELNKIDSEALYDLLENDIVPLYYERNEKGIPEKWIQVMKNSLLSIMPVFNTHRMVKEYVRKMYIPAIQNGETLSANNFELAKSLARWTDKIQQNWSQVKIELDGKLPTTETVTLTYGQSMKLQAVIHLGTLSPQDIKAQVFLKKNNTPWQLDSSTNFEIVEMKLKKDLGDNKYLYESNFVPSDSGLYNFTIRVLPYHPNLGNPVELGLAHWL